VALALPEVANRQRHSSAAPPPAVYRADKALPAQEPDSATTGGVAPEGRRSRLL